MRVAIRVDASRAIGTGHVRRCLALAEALRRSGAQVRFVSRDHGLDVAATIAPAGFDVAMLPPPPADFAGDPAVPHGAWAGVAAEQDVAETVAAVRTFAPNWVVIDHYGFDARWHDGVRNRLRCRVAAIDDVADRGFACDLLIDHNHARDHRAKYRSVLPASADLLGGPHYALLGPAFADAPRYAFREAVGSIGIFMGGVDLPNTSLAVLEGVEAAGFGGPVEIVATSANPNLPTLHEAAARRPATRITTDLQDLAAFFARHDLQVGAGGGASWERCCIGVPTLLLVIADNQLAVAPDLAADGIAALVEPPQSCDPHDIGRAVAALIDDPARRAELARRARALVDGRGAARVAARMMEEAHA